jgi:hypothetical protein
VQEQKLIGAWDFFGTAFQKRFSLLVALQPHQTQRRVVVSLNFLRIYAEDFSEEF